MAESKVKFAIENYPDDFLECRAGQHVWKRPGAKKNRTRGMVLTDDGKYVQVKKQCEVCKTIKVELIDPRTGECIDREYQHPAGYLLTGIKRRPKKAGWRKALYSDLLDDLRG